MVEVKIEGVDKFVEIQEEALRAALLLNTKLEKKLRAAISREIREARSKVVNQIKFGNGDPRGTRHSICRIVYKKILGGGLYIPPQTKRSAPNSYEAPRKLRPGQRGGNRMLRSQRTQDILSYGPLDRGWILRIINGGTHPRYANGRNGKWRNGGNRTFFKLQKIGDYYRGSVAPRNFFGNYGGKALDTAITNLSNIIEEEFDNIFNE